MGGNIVNNAETTTGCPSDVERGNYEDEKALLDQIRSVGGREVQGIAILSFRALQLYRISDLQKELLLKQKSVMSGQQGTEGDNGRQTDKLLQRYANAVRNYETLSQNLVLDKIDGYKFLDDKCQRFHLEYRKGSSKWASPRWKFWEDKTVTVAATEPSAGFFGPLGFRELDKQKRVERERRSAYHSRFGMGLFGGVALIVPMIIMALHPGLVVDLVTTSAATVIFILIVTIFGRDATGKDVLASTAAYAAILIVFVGTSLDLRAH
ncbi:hypothetical protein BDV27DRAFT_135359 [Aspergillus caelatus]|uniref:DUF6594 domain-containing protein n=1 Tax=Aspergillus caelatus TaxID=61420 RepID=A0A5N6ZRR1_9EURO|nr:uncharacterized protein BDV27DRAFT_135359 [Aspergillus caelatus]KAE8359903.1 hypothetical protein BDV27DRAFT_135359 [Aspergillus caelatus]